MKQELLSFLKNQFTQNPIMLDRLIVSSFLIKNNIEIVHNRFLKDYVILTEDVQEKETLNEFLKFWEWQEVEFNLETLIELFELVISPSEKVVNGAVYTPKNIRDYIVDNCLSMYNGDLAEIKSADISCGCGGFLMTLAQKIYELTDKSYKEIFEENLYGIDIADYSIQRTKILLTLFAIINKEDEKEFQFNLYTGNSLTFNWNQTCLKVKGLGGFDIIVGNPPYVCSRNMDAETLTLMKNWYVAKTGHPDLYIPFFQIGIENLNATGILGYITVNTFIKSVNGRALREYFSLRKINLSILNFGGEQVFQDRNTYTCICIVRPGEGGIKYLRTTSKELIGLDLSPMYNFEYDDLNHFDGWNLVNDLPMVNFINLIENTGIPFKDLYTTRNGIATLKNDVYKFTPTHDDDEFYYLREDDRLYPIEKAICKNIVNANKIKTEIDILLLREQIIFPYDEQTKVISEDLMLRDYPKAYTYLQTKRVVLSGRDKGKREYETWYAYGRRQSMDIHAYKLFFPHICERPTFVICKDLDLLFYNGIAIVSDDLEKLKVIKKIMESDLFFKYIVNTTKDYASGYISMSRNYLKNFGVFQFDEVQKSLLLDTNDVDGLLEGIYGIHELV